MKNSNNHKQDIEIAEMKKDIKYVCEKVETFVGNEFYHFKKSVDNKFSWLTGLVIIGILIPILLYIIK